jgi:hypothetical protein
MGNLAKALVDARDPRSTERPLTLKRWKRLLDGLTARFRKDRTQALRDDIKEQMRDLGV